MKPPYPVGTLCYLVGSSDPGKPAVTGKVATIRGHGQAPDIVLLSCLKQGRGCNCADRRTVCWLTDSTTVYCAARWSALRPIAPPPQRAPAPAQEVEA